MLSMTVLELLDG
jgi:hypothetical protein